MKSSMKSLTKSVLTVAAGYVLYKVMEKMAKDTTEETVKIEEDYVTREVNILDEETVENMENEKLAKIFMEQGKYFAKIALLGLIYGYAVTKIWEKTDEDLEKMVEERIINYRIQLV